jgi:hypothetical protein
MGSMGQPWHDRFFILFANKLKSRCKRLLVGLHFHMQIKLARVLPCTTLQLKDELSSQGGGCHRAAAQSMEAIRISSGLGLVDKD